MDSFIHPVLSLQELCLLKLATIICDDPDMKNFVQKHGNDSFVFPSKEALMFMDRNEERVGDTWRRKEILVDATEIVDLKDRLQYFSTSPRNMKLVSINERSDILPFRKWEELVDDKFSLFLLPKSLRPKLLEIVRTVAIQIDRWVKDLSPIIHDSAEIAHNALCYFQWTSLGRINRRKTAKTIIINKGCSEPLLCVLAEYYDLMDDLDMDKEKVDFYRKGIDRKFWMFLTGEVYCDPKDPFNYSLLSYLNGHCLQYPDLMLGLSELTLSDKIKFYKVAGFQLLLFFLDWPLQRQFLEASELLLPFFDTDEFHAILRIILYDRILLGRKDFNYIGLLKSFWHQSSSELKEFIEGKPIYEPLMFTVNYPNEEAFPNEKLFESNFNNRLTFQYQGVKYSLFRTDRVYRKFRHCFFDLTRPRYIEEVSYVSQKRKHDDLDHGKLGEVGI
ncbi:uncharacterized protein TNIN_234531 [Trichonephila inaurata madagascariensis]|uniref:Uncharacterized protein n=1 Tax=Trichonephila inaurata madagascariensis TaxID=2747483 RepID=A0A8X6XVZ7_9ARAC|nr:uncharacterized protein TNIN_234531 [Trichonephila inaurata madagascariensis]